MYTANPNSICLAALNTYNLLFIARSSRALCAQGFKK